MLLDTAAPQPEKKGAEAAAWRAVLRLRVQEAAGSAGEHGSGLGGAGDCRSWSVDLAGFCRSLPEVERVLEAAELLGRCGAEVLELGRSLGSGLEGCRGLAHGSGCKGSPEKTTARRRRNGNLRL